MIWSLRTDPFSVRFRPIQAIGVESFEMSEHEPAAYIGAAASEGGHVG